MTILKRIYKLLVLLAVVFISTSAIVVYLPSCVYEWKDLKVNEVKDGEVRQIIKSETKTLVSLDVCATLVNKGKKFKVGSVSGNQEEFMILKEGKVSQMCWVPVHRFFLHPMICIAFKMSVRTSVNIMQSVG